MKGNRLASISIALIICGGSLSAQTAEQADTLDMAVISAKAPAAFTGLKRLNKRDLISGTAVMGTPDVIKVLQNLPGVASGVELTSGLYVHGGDGSDNLYLLDGVPLFQIAHLGGLFSSFNTDIVESLDFYKSGFLARYGGKLSSVVDVTTQDGSMEKFGGDFSIGLIDGRVNLHGPIIKDKLSYDVAVRRSWLDAVVAAGLAVSNTSKKRKMNAGYALFDTNVNLTYIPSENDKVNIRFFAGTDDADFGEHTKGKLYGDKIYNVVNGNNLDLMWGNLAASSSWKHKFSKKVSMSTLAYYSRAYSNITNWREDNNLTEDNEIFTDRTREHIFSSVNLAGVKASMEVLLAHHRFSAGVDYVYSWYDPTKTVDRTRGGEPVLSQGSAVTYRTNEVSAYLEDEMIYGPFNLTAGVRLDGYFVDGASYFRPQPRVSASYYITKDIVAKASYEMMSQYSHLLTSMYIDLPTNIWLPSTDKVKPSDSQQFAAGLNMRFSKRWHVDISGYYRDISNCLMYAGNGALFPPIERWEEDFMSGRGRSYGAELEVKYLSNAFQCAVNYTLSWTERKFKELHHTWFRDRFDNRHKLTLSATYNITDDIDINATWNYHSGNRATVPEYMVSIDNWAWDLFSQPYNVKLPDYHRLDLSCNFHRKTRRGNESVWNISIYNAYCRLNPIMMRVNTYEDGRMSALYYSYIPIIPSFSYTLKF